MKKCILAIVIIAILGGMIFVINRKQDWIYVLKERISSINSHATVEEIRKKKIEWREYTLEELQQDSRITYNASLMLINTTYPIAKNYKAKIVKYKNTTVRMDVCMKDAYSKMSGDILRKFQQKLYVLASYRTAKKQRDMIVQYGKTATAVGSSEHQAGLALDVHKRGYAGAAFIKSDIGQYVNSNCWKYGFVIRYPYYGEKETGIGYEPWHIRYVGKPHAEIMYKNQMTLETYLESIKMGKIYKYRDYVIYKQKRSNRIRLPEKFKKAVVSSDNIGHLIITLKK